MALLEVKQLSPENFHSGMKILDNELGNERVRSSDLLREKLKECPEFFIGIYLDEELVGVICGFPREDYLLISEVAIDCRFRRRKFGERLVREFEKVGFGKYDKINVGALDDSIEFYKSLGYSPFLLVQFKKGAYNREDFSEFEILSSGDSSVELEVEDCSLGELNLLRETYPKAKLQYIFMKEK